MKKLYFFALGLILFSSCTKETYVEGLIAKTSIVEVNQKFQFERVSQNEERAFISLNVDGIDKGFYIFKKKYKLGTLQYTPYLNANPQDSILRITTRGSSTLYLAAENNNGYTLIKNYTESELINPTSYINPGFYDIDFFLAIKKSPYTQSWSVLNSYQTPNFTEIFEWKLSVEGYLGFSTYPMSPDFPSDLNEAPLSYGWIDMTINEKYIEVHRIGYQNSQSITAGK